MSEKTISNVRVINKHDIEENWLKATGFTPKQGELIVYDIDANYNYERIKIGDGVQNVNALPFAVAQSDWSQNDPDAMNYIQNRTHWDESFVLDVSSSDMSYDFSSGFGFVRVSDDPNDFPDDIEGLIVEYNNKTYTNVTCNAWPTYDASVHSIDINGAEYSIAVAIRKENANIDVYKNGTRYDMVNPGIGVWVIYDPGTSSNAKAKIYNKNVHQLDEKFIPDTIATTEYVDNAIATIPTPDVSGQIEAHNMSETAHSDIRTSVGDLKALVGDTSVQDQIAAANMIYVGPDMPTDPSIKVWINTAEEGTGIVPVMPRVSTISLAASAWTGSSAPYSQVVTVNTVTPATKVELNPTVAQIVSLQNEDIALTAENNSGVVTVYSFGGKPSTDMTMQVTLTEVSYV